METEGVSSLLTLKEDSEVIEAAQSDSETEGADVDPNLVEERFRVDRRKLEQMIQTQGNVYCSFILNIVVFILIS